MAIMGITLVVMFLAVAINIKGADLKKSDLEYSIREQNLEQQKEEEEKRTAELQDQAVCGGSGQRKAGVSESG